MSVSAPPHSNSTQTPHRLHTNSHHNHTLSWVNECIGSASHKLNTNSTQAPHRLYTSSPQTPHKLYTSFPQTPHNLYTSSPQTPHKLHTDSTQAPRKRHASSTQTPHKLHTNSTSFQLAGIGFHSETFASDRDVDHISPPLHYIQVLVI